MDSSTAVPAAVNPPTLRPQPSAPVTPGTPPRRRSPLLFPPGAARPLVLLWVWILPQALLLFLNLRTWELASGEVNTDQRLGALAILIAEIALLAAGVVGQITLTVLRRNLTRVLGFAMVMAASVFLSITFLESSRVIPRSLQDWIIRPEQWVYLQFALVMPAAIFGAFRCLCPDREDNIIGSASLTLAALAMPFFVIGSVMGLAFLGATFGSSGLALSHFVLPIYIAGSTMLLGAILRVCVSAYVAARRSNPAVLAALTAIVALVLPICGLLLNAAIPFPTDFQLAVIYALAVVNGCVLLLPNFSNPLAHRVVWLLQCATFPFTVYFFAVFLPLMPLMPLACFVMGLGLLMAVPSALFLLHGYRILDGFHGEIRDGSRWLPMLLGVAAFCAGPAFLVSRIAADRASLHGALDYTTYPDFSKAGTFKGDRSALRQSLIRMRDFKQGLYLPYYSQFYNWLAFDNLVLPNKTLDGTYRTFFGESLPEPRRDPMGLPFGSPGSRRSADEVLTGPVGLRPKSDAVMRQMHTVISKANGSVRTRAEITVFNPTGSPTEYQASIRFPDGAFLTGMWLTIAGERVPARLFEQRAAEWVYQKITEVRPVPRDPAILRLTGPNSADLRVYPVDAQGERFVEVEFTYPENLDPTITIGDRSLDLPDSSTQTPLVVTSGNEAYAWVPKSALPSGIVRKPAPHLVIDISRNSELRDPVRLEESVKHALDAFPTAESAHITFANFGTTPFRDGMAVPVKELRTIEGAAILLDAPRFAGGFLPGRAIKQILVQHDEALQKPAATFDTYPAIVVLRGTTPEEPSDDMENLPVFAALAPDAQGYWETSPSIPAPEFHAFEPSTERAPVKVAIVDLGGRRSVVPTDRDAFVRGTSDAKLSIFDSTGFVPLDTRQVNDAELVASAQASRLETDHILNPSVLGKSATGLLLENSRKAHTLLRSTSFMVVETSAQWKMLERAEKKVLGGHDAMTLTDTPTSAVPEPSTTLLIVVAAITVAAWHGRRRLAPWRRALADRLSGSRGIDGPSCRQ